MGPKVLDFYAAFWAPRVTVVEFFARIITDHDR
jgi:hypothetical protein